MNEMKLKYMKREFKDIEVTKFKRVITETEGPDDPDDIERKRSMELIYLDQVVYLVIKEAVKELTTEEIYYNLMVLRYDPRTSEVKELFKKQLNKNPLKSVGFTCERIAFIRYQQCLYFFVYDRDWSTE